MEYSPTDIIGGKCTISVILLLTVGGTPFYNK